MNHLASVAQQIADSLPDSITDSTILDAIDEVFHDGVEPLTYGERMWLFDRIGDLWDTRMNA